MLSNTEKIWSTKRILESAKSIRIVEYLLENGPSSFSDEAFSKEVRTPRSTLRRRLTEMVDRIHLEVSEEKTGKISRTIHSLPEVNFPTEKSSK